MWMTFLVVLAFLALTVGFRFAVAAWTNRWGARWNAGETLDPVVEERVLPSHTLTVVGLVVLWLLVGTWLSAPWHHMLGGALMGTGYIVGGLLLIISAPFQVFGLHRRRSVFVAALAFVALGYVLAGYGGLIG